MRSLLLVFFSILAGSLHAGSYVQFRTIYGNIEVELFDQDKPATVQNFLRYVKSGAYRDMFFHRCVPGFVVQGGGFFTTNRYEASNFVSVSEVPTFGNLTNEFGVGTRLSNVYGTIAMAKIGGDTNSATSQFYFNLADNVFLDANNSNNLFVVFGKTRRGTNVLNNFNSRAPGFGIYTNIGGVFGSLPVTYVGNYYPYYNELVYVDVSLLNVQVSKTTNGAAEISWTSVSNVVNQVQFTTNFPPIWQSLVNTNGNGSTLKVVDPSGGSQRFYRVNVVY